MTANQHIVCPACGKTNRVPGQRMAEAPKCGACGAALFSGRPTDVDMAGFDRHARADDIPILVDVWAPWCGPCRMMTPMFARAAGKLEPHVRLLKVNMDNSPDLARRYGIQSVPTLLLMHKGRLLGQAAGAMDTERIVAWTRQHTH